MSGIAPFTRTRGRHAALRRPRSVRTRLLVGLLLYAALAAGGIGIRQMLDHTYRLPLVVAAVPYWDSAAATASALAHDDVVDAVSPWWFGVTPDGLPQSQLPGGTPAEDAVVGRLSAAGTQVVPTVADVTGGTWTPQVIQAIIHDPQRVADHIRALTALAARPGFAGLQIDYEDLTATDRAAFSSFVAQLSVALHARGELLWVTVHPKADDAGYDERNRAQDYAAIGRAADRVIVMAYDWHWASSGPGSIAPIGWVDDVLTYASSQIPPRKIVLGVGLYGYDWVGRNGRPVVWQEVQALLARPGVEPGRDQESGSPMLRYVQDGQGHEVWYEDARSITAKLDLAVRHRLGGVELWRLGSEDPALWNALASRSAA